MTNSKKTKTPGLPSAAPGKNKKLAAASSRSKKLPTPGSYIFGPDGNIIIIKDKAHAYQLSQESFNNETKKGTNLFDHVNVKTPDEKRQLIIFNLLFAIMEKLDSSLEENYLNQMQRHYFFSTFQPISKNTLSPEETRLFIEKWNNADKYLKPVN